MHSVTPQRCPCPTNYGFSCMAEVGFTVGLHACFSSEKHENILMLIFVKKYRDTVSRTTHQAWGRGVLTGLVLCSLDSGLQVSWRVEVLALVSAAAAFNIVHADNDRVLVAVHHARLQGVSVAAVVLTSRAVPALEFSANLAGAGGSTDQHSPFIVFPPNIETQQLHAGCIPPACLCAHVFVRRCHFPWLPDR